VHHWISLALNQVSLLITSLKFFFLIISLKIHLKNEYDTPKMTNCITIKKIWFECPHVAHDVSNWLSPLKEELESYWYCYKVYGRARGWWDPGVPPYGSNNQGETIDLPLGSSHMDASAHPFFKSWCLHIRFGYEPMHLPWTKEMWWGWKLRHVPLEYAMYKNSKPCEIGFEFVHVQISKCILTC
jgi:hypothetical protein